MPDLALKIFFRIGVMLKVKVSSLTENYANEC